MKTISGKVISSKPISLARASKTLSKFASSETGASDAVSACLRRAADAFNELVQLHKELKASKSRRSLSELESESKTEDFANEVSVKEEEEEKKKKKKKKKERIENDEVSNGGVWESEVKENENGEESETEKKRHKKERTEKAEEGEDGERIEGEEEKREKKKRKSVAVQENGIEDSEEKHSSKKKKRRKIEECSFQTLYSGKMASRRAF